MNVKHALFRAARAVGLFALARRLTRRRVRVLGYHGFATADEAHFRPKLFISGAKLQRRLELLRRWRFRAATLDELADALERHLPLEDAVVVTIDDGFASTLSVAAPLLKAARFPATVFLTSYHMLSQTPVFDLAVGYLLWKAKVSTASLPMPGGEEPMVLDLSTPAGRDAALEGLLEVGHGFTNEAERVVFRQSIAQHLGLQEDPLARGDGFRLLSLAEATLLADHGVQIGLHTHRHWFPPHDLNACRRELLDNRAHLEPIAGRALQHFCYPSGIYAPAQADVLREMGVRTACTCDTGLVVVSASHRLELPRFLDGEEVSDLEFEAEMSGFAELLRKALRVRRRGGDAGSR